MIDFQIGILCGEEWRRAIIKDQGKPVVAAHQKRIGVLRRDDYRTLIKRGQILDMSASGIGQKNGRSL